jgi:predicted RNA-binding Zn-ribbon protein involved in translation (DUF1610 family)
MSEGQVADVHCPECGSVMFRKVLMDEVHWAVSDTTPAELKHDGEEAYFLCPQCGAKQVVIEATSSNGVSVLRLSHVKD